MFAEPARREARKDLATQALQRGDTRLVLPILTGSSVSSIEGDREALHLLAVAELESGSAFDALRSAQKAVRITPWDMKNWQTLVLVRSRVVS